jgi:hypothetical protein
MVQADPPAFYGKVRELAELHDFIFIDGNDAGIKDHHALVLSEHRAEIEMEILFPEGKHAFPVVYPPRSEKKGLCL